MPVASWHATKAAGDLPQHINCRSCLIDASVKVIGAVMPHAASAASIVGAPPPPLPAGSLYYEIVEARLKEGLHFRGGGQTVRFGDSPQVRFPLRTDRISTS